MVRQGRECGGGHPANDCKACSRSIVQQHCEATSTTHVLCTLIVLTRQYSAAAAAAAAAAVAALLVPCRPLQIATAIVLAVGFQGDNKLDHGTAIAALVLICVYVAAFAWSW